MGLFWDLYQQSQLSEHDERAESLEKRVQRLEGNLDKTRQLLAALLQRLETHFGEDINKDGKIG